MHSLLFFVVRLLYLLYLSPITQYLSPITHHLSPITIDQLNAMTPIKNQGKSQTCWIYAMLAAIETEHIGRGDSVNLSAIYVERMLAEESSCPDSHRGTGAIALAMLSRYGVVPYDAVPSPESHYPSPRHVFMLGAEYTPQEFARSVCAPGEYATLTTNRRKPYYTEIAVDTEDNWMNLRYLNLPADSLLSLCQRAVRQHHGVCWESKSHAMAIVGLAHDNEGQQYFIMKNSWGTSGLYGGLTFLSNKDFLNKTLAVELPQSLLNSN